MFAVPFSHSTQNVLKGTTYYLPHWGSRVTATHGAIRGLQNYRSKFTHFSSFKRAFSRFLHRGYSSSAKRPYASSIRNLGIIAHVDAGKTTTSERMLYYSGESRVLGDVDNGDTVLDYLKIERERGITINAAAITFHWKDHNINLIDTPGHVDFTAEVERSVRVLDGAVTILDGVAGVQAQTETVWSQANRYSVPRIVFINKMDREGASVQDTMESIRTRLRANPVLTQLPLGSAKNLFGVIDLIRLEEIVWDADSLGSKYEKRPVDREGSAYEIVREARVALIEAVAELDDQLMEFVFSSSDPSFLDVTSDMLTAAIRRVTLANKAVPVFLGSSLKNIGVQPVMDAVVDFLPSPLEREMPVAFKPTLTLDSEEEVDMERKLVGSDSSSAGTSSNATATSGAKKEASGGIQTGTTFQLKCDPKAPLVGQAFKVVHEARSNSLVVYVRIYAGSMTSGMKLMNTTRGKEERSLRLTRVRAERYEDLKELQAGDIGAVTGLKNTSTGDTLVGQKDPQLCVKGMNIPEPVFFMSILADSASEEDHLKNSLGLLQLEDPSFKWMINKETGQWLLCGMGELHLEIIKDRLFNYYKVKAATGDIQIAYKSTIRDDVTEHLIKSYTVGGRSEDVNLTVELESLGIGEGSSFEIDESVMHGLSNFKKARADLTAAFQEAAQDMFRSGVPAGYPLLDTKITLSSLAYSPSTSTHTYKLALMEAIFVAARSTGVQILEPIMKVEIEVNDEFSGGVISDLSSKRNGIIGHVTHHGGSKKKLIQAHVPLKDLLGYSTDLRSLSKGTGAMIMEFAHNGPLTDSQQTKLLGTTYFNG